MEVARGLKSGNKDQSIYKNGDSSLLETVQSSTPLERNGASGNPGTIVWDGMVQWTASSRRKRTVLADGNCCDHEVARRVQSPLSLETGTGPQGHPVGSKKGDANIIAWSQDLYGLQDCDNEIQCQQSVSACKDERTKRSPNADPA